MKASETTLSVLLGGPKQLRVPLFQRSYAWKSKHWRTLWQDIVRTYESTSEHAHFIGAVVSRSEGAPLHAVNTFTLIDGQQRLTTLCILLASIRDAAKPSSASVADRINDWYLTNQHVDGEERFKVLPTQADRGAFKEVINGTPDAPPSSIRDAYVFFSRLIKSGLVDDDNVKHAF